MGPVGVYMAIAAIFAYATLANFWIAKRPVPQFHQELGAIQSIREGIAYVFSSQVLIGSMALDLFAVLFVGAIALLPIFATDILNADRDLVGWIDRQLRTANNPPGPERPARMREALIGPLRHVYGVSDKVLSMDSPTKNVARPS